MSDYAQSFEPVGIELRRTRLIGDERLPTRPAAAFSFESGSYLDSRLFCECLARRPTTDT